MSSTSQPTTFADLVTDLQNRARVTTAVSATETQAKRYINTALHDMHLGFDYKLPWCERQGTLIVQAPYSTGTVSITAGSATLTGSGTAWNTNNTYGVANMRVGGKVIIAGSTDIYRVSAVAGDTSATLATRFVSSSDASATTYTYFEDEYALASDFLRPVDLQFFSSAYNIPIVSRTEFRRRIPRRNISGQPAIACLMDEGFNGTTAPVRKIVLYPYPDRAYIVPYAYISNVVGVSSAGADLTSLSADSDEPIVPLRYRHAIVLHALANWYRDKRDDARSQEVRAEYIDLVQRIVADHDFGTHATAQLRPGGNYWASARRPYRMRGGKIYDLNDDFDSFRR